MRSWIFSIITPVFSVTWSRNHSNMPICWFLLLSMLKSFLLLNSFVKTLIFIQDSLINRKHLFEIEIFWDIINVFTVTFKLFNVSLLNKSSNILLKVLNLACSKLLNGSKTFLALIIRKSAYKHIISEGSRDTEDCSKNSALHHSNKLHLYYNRKHFFYCNNISRYYCFYCISHQI